MILFAWSFAFEIFLCFNYHFVFFVIIIIRLLIMMLSKNYANRLVAFLLSYAITSKDFVKYNVFFLYKIAFKI